MKYYALAFMMTLAACGSTGGSWKNNHYYDKQCSNALYELGMCR